MSVLYDLYNKPDFTESEEIIADYVLTNIEQIADMNIGEIAKNTNTSNATIIRLCRKVGTNGFKDFKMTVIRERERMHKEDFSGDVSFPFYDRNSPIIVMDRLAETYHYAIDACSTDIPANVLQDAALLLNKAEHIYIYASGESDLVGNIFMRRMMRIGHLCFQISEYQETLAITDRMTKNDVALFISYSGNGILRYENDVQAIRANNIPSIIITANTHIKDFTHIIHMTKGENNDSNAGTFYSTIASLYILDSLYSMIFAKDFEKMKNRKDDIDKKMRNKKNRFTLK